MRASLKTLKRLLLEFEPPTLLPALLNADSKEKMSAFLAYMVRGETVPLLPYKNSATQDGKIAFFSNICFVVWLILAILLVGVGLLVFQLFGFQGVVPDGLLVLALLHSV